jgi:hypothetical protein
MELFKNAKEVLGHIEKTEGKEKVQAYINEAVLSYYRFMTGGRSKGKSEADFDPIQIRAGMKVEKEHTIDMHVAKKIAMDHLSEDPDYYIKLKTIESD